MKKILIFIMVVVFLVACGNNEEVEKEQVETHENINDNVIEDAKKIVSIISKGIKKNKIPTNDSFDWFINKYGIEIDHLNDEEFEVIMAASLMIINTEDYFNESQDYRKDVDRLHKVMETGEYQSLTKPNEYYDNYYDKVATGFRGEDKIEDEESKEYIDEKESPPLPFDINDFADRYNEIIEGFEGFENPMKLFVEERVIALTFGGVIEAQVLLNTLNEFSEGDVINELASEMVLDLVENGYYVKEEVINGFDIKINAIDISSVTVIITKEK